MAAAADAELVSDRLAVLQRSARRRSVTATTTRRGDWRDLVTDERIGLFDNGGPNSLHAEPTVAAAEAGKHVICEKPLGWDAGQLRHCSGSLRPASSTSALQLPASWFRLARELIEAGELGEIRHFRGRYLQDWADDPTLDTWRFHPDEAGSGALGGIGTHAIDLGRFLNGEMTSVSGFVKMFVPGRTVDDALEAVVEFENGSVGTIEGTRARARPPQRVPAGDQRLERLAGVRHGAAERAAGVRARRRPRARLQDRARLGDGR